MTALPQLFDFTGQRKAKRLQQHSTAQPDWLITTLEIEHDPPFSCCLLQTFVWVGVLKWWWKRLRALAALLDVCVPMCSPFADPPALSLCVCAAGWDDGPG